MQDFVGKTAFVTGGANGIGFALGQAFAETGMNVMLADIEQDALTAAVERLRGFGPKVRGLICDVTDPASVDQSANKTFETFGNVHVLCNNAGVAGGSGVDDISLDTARLIIHNDSHGLKRQAANIAHELAHGVLFHPPKPPFDVLGSRHYDPVIEEEANWLGPALLVSEEAANHIARMELTPAKASDVYKVSEQLMLMRLNVTGALIRASRRRQNVSLSSQ